MKKKTISLGDVCVDTGTLVIGDPCNIGNFSYGELYTTELGEELADGEAVVLSTGFGDGFYEVKAEVVDFGKGIGERITKVWIDFIEVEEPEPKKTRKK